MSLPIDKIPDAQLLTNPYLALQKSGEIRPGAGEIQADKTMEKGAELLGGTQKLLNAQFASEDKTSITKGQNEASKMLHEAERAAAEAPPEVAQASFDSAVTAYKESVMRNEGYSALARDDILAFVDKFEPSFQSSVITSSATRQARSEVAALSELTDGYLDQAMAHIRTGNPEGGTQAIAKHNEMMDDALSRFMAGVGTAFGSKEQARTVWEDTVVAHTETLLESMISTHDPAYKGQIEEILGNPDIPLKNFAQYERAHNYNESTWKEENRGARQAALIDVLNDSTLYEGRHGMDRVRIQDPEAHRLYGGRNPERSTYMAAWDTVVAARDASDGEITIKWAAEEARKSFIAYVRNNSSYFSAEDLRYVVKDAKTHKIFEGASIDWSKETGVLHHMLSTKVSDSSEAIVKAGRRLEDMANGDVPFTSKIIGEEMNRLLSLKETRGNHVYYDTSIGFVDYTPEEARFDAVIGLFGDLANHPEKEGRGKDNYEALKEYITEDLGLGTKINAIVKQEQGTQNEKTLTEAAVDNAIAVVQVGSDTDGDGIPDKIIGIDAAGIKMTKPLDAAISRRINDTFLAGDSVGAEQLLDDFGKSGQMLQAHSDYVDMLLEPGTSDDLGKAFDFLRKMEVYDPEHINKIFGKSTFEGFGDSDTKETLANLFKHGGRQGQDRLQALIERDPENLGTIRNYSKTLRGIGSGDANVTTAFDEANGNTQTVRYIIDRIVGQDAEDGIYWTRTEQNKYSPLVGMLLTEHFGDKQPTAEEITAYINDMEFVNEFKALYDGAGLTFAGLGASNQIPLETINAADLNDNQTAALYAEAEAHAIGYTDRPVWYAVGLTKEATVGVIGTMLADVKEHREEAGGDLTNAFFVNAENATDLTKDSVSEGNTLVVVPTIFNGQVNGFVVAELTKEGEMQPWQHPLAKNGRISVDQDGDLMGGELPQLQLDLLGSMFRNSINAPTSLRKKGIQEGDIVKMWLHAKYIDAEQAEQAGMNE